MRRLRRGLGPIAVGWLLCQAATMALVPVALWAGAAAETLLECTCTHGDHAICPMHHKLAPGSKLCLMGSADDDGTAALTSLFGAVGVVPAPPSTARPASRLVISRAEATTPSLRPAAPDPPPPRL